MSSLGLYLEVSIKWWTKTAVMIKILLSSLLFSVGHLFCMNQDLGWGMKCVNRYEEAVLLPCLAVEALTVGVILDDSGWRNKLRNLRGGCSPSSVAPINNDVEMHNIGTPVAAPQDQTITYQQQDQVKMLLIHDRK